MLVVCWFRWGCRFTYMHECRCDEDACTEVFAGEEDGGWYLHPFDLFGYDREATSWKMSACVFSSLVA